ncbi:MAG: hypothetical protein Q7V57_09335 [Actinomycetota bacterium]|nr:hypothetical protein [Actinomycetota bacterium]
MTWRRRFGLSLSHKEMDRALAAGGFADRAVSGIALLPAGAISQWWRTSFVVIPVVMLQRILGYWLVLGVALVVMLVLQFVASRRRRLPVGFILIRGSEGLYLAPGGKVALPLSAESTVQARPLTVFGLESAAAVQIVDGDSRWVGEMWNTKQSVERLKAVWGV